MPANEETVVAILSGLLLVLVIVSLVELASYSKVESSLTTATPISRASTISRATIR